MRAEVKLSKSPRYEPARPTSEPFSTMVTMPLAGENRSRRLMAVVHGLACIFQSSLWMPCTGRGEWMQSQCLLQADNSSRAGPEWWQQRCPSERTVQIAEKALHPAPLPPGKKKETILPGAARQALRLLSKWCVLTHSYIFHQSIRMRPEQRASCPGGLTQTWALVVTEMPALASSVRACYSETTF